MRFHGSLNILANAAVFQRFLRQLFRQKWVVYAKKPFGGLEHVLQYLARYTHRVAISNHRLIAFDGDKVTFRWKDYAHKNKKRKMTLSADEFLRRFLLHVLPRGFVRIRHYGFFAGRNRAELLPVCQRLLTEASSLPTPASGELLLKTSNTNGFPSVFATVLIAFHELLIREKKAICDYSGVQNALKDLNSRIATGMKGTSPEERRKNVDVVRGLIGAFFVDAQNGPMIHGNHATTDIEAITRRSEIELADYELKQGYLTLSPQREPDENIIPKVLKTICAIANNGPNRMGKVILGVTDKEQDAERTAHFDAITPKKVGKRFFVGIKREASFLKISVETYLSTWKKAIKTSGLSAHLRDSVLSSIDFNDFYGLGVIVITIPPQKELSYLRRTSLLAGG